MIYRLSFVKKPDAIFALDALLQISHDGFQKSCFSLF